MGGGPVNLPSVPWFYHRARVRPGPKAAGRNWATRFARRSWPWPPPSSANTALDNLASAPTSTAWSLEDADLALLGLARTSEDGNGGIDPPTFLLPLFPPSSFPPFLIPPLHFRLTANS